jgi:tripartite-type tricarboxylate transporter receptor subunit TctC
MKTLLRALAVVALSLTFGYAAAQDFPNRPVHWILSQPAGSSPDITARLLADQLAKSWNQQVLVDNRPGGQNVIGAQAAAKSPGDGYNYYFATTAALVSNPLTFKSHPTAPSATSSVAMISKSPMVIASATPCRQIARRADRARQGKAGQARRGNEAPRPSAAC